MTDELKSTLDQLRQLGCDIGGPMTTGMHDVVVFPFACPANDVAGCVVLNNWMISYEAVSLYEDGHWMTHTTLPDQGFERPAGHRFARVPGVTVGELIREHISERPAGARRALALAEVPAAIKEYTEEEYHWRASRGGLTDDEWARHISIRYANPPENDEKAKEMEQSIRMVKAMVRAEAQVYIAMRAREAFLKQTSLSAAEWEDVDDRCLFIHAHSDVEQLAHMFATKDGTEQDATVSDSEQPDHSAPTPKYEAVVKELEAGPIPDVVERLNAEAPESRRLTRLGDITLTGKYADIPVSIWVRPKFDGDQDD